VVGQEGDRGKRPKRRGSPSLQNQNPTGGHGNISKFSLEGAIEGLRTKTERRFWWWEKEKGAGAGLT